LRETWPTVVHWLRWREGEGPMPDVLREPEPEPEEPRWNDQPEEYFEVDFDYELLSDEVVGAVRNGWRAVGDAFRDVGDTVHNLRWQVPRLTRLERMTGRTVVSASRTLAEQARNIPKETFFLWRDRAFSYADADTRVSHVTRGLIHCGIRPGDRVGVMMQLRPSYLSLVTALNRLGAVAVLLDPALSDDALRSAFEQEPLRALGCDPSHAGRCRDVFDGDVLVLGSGRDRKLAADVTDMEAIDPHSVDLPGWYKADRGRARDLAMVLVRAASGGRPKIARVTNGRWAFSALGVASAATLTPADTVYSCLPLHHPAGILVSVGGALMGGSRLALSPGFDPKSFWSEVRRYGATVVFYAGEMARPLINAPLSHSDRNHPVRLFAGSGMRADVWSRLHERFGVGVLEFYASTERNLVLANASGEKMGALGRPLPGSADMALVRYDFGERKLVEQGGRLRRCDADMPGVVIARAREHAQGPAVRRDVFADGDRWYVTGDVLRKDRDGDYWFVDRLANVLCTDAGPVGTPRIEDALYELTEVELAVAYGVDVDGRTQPVAAVVTDSPLDAERITKRLCKSLGVHERPRRIDRVTRLPMTEGFRPIKAKLRAEGPEEVLETLRYDPETQTYR
jgi:putative long chain acyl-CoA synthase